MIVYERIYSDDTLRDCDTDGDGNVDGGALFLQICGREIKHSPFKGNVEPDVLQCALMRSLLFWTAASESPSSRRGTSRAAMSTSTSIGRASMPTTNALRALDSIPLFEPLFYVEEYLVPRLPPLRRDKDLIRRCRKEPL